MVSLHAFRPLAAAVIDTVPSAVRTNRYARLHTCGHCLTSTVTISQLEKLRMLCEKQMPRFNISYRRRSGHLGWRVDMRAALNLTFVCGNPTLAGGEVLSIAITHWFLGRNDAHFFMVDGSKCNFPFWAPQTAHCTSVWTQLNTFGYIQQNKPQLLFENLIPDMGYACKGTLKLPSSYLWLSFSFEMVTKSQPAVLIFFF